ncbi:glycosyltransferase family 2 protein [uncultured Phascolarctobacterium sp.]|uniref:glycosyltransferase family 2 protein n=1 Tax=uncultured Phascolarctobacterium sp. TaxID=512296 RepID=UPI0026262AAC|nr:glycosyltransferase family 2 protein [uncultured Phascolarctobacterium sp.]
MEKYEYPLISVIIPCFNLEKVIGKCIESIINQTYGNIEIIIVNDGSVDNSLAVIEGYAKEDKRIIVIDQPNCGVGAAYNQGLKKSTGKFIYIVDGDNYVDYDLVKVLYNHITENDCDVVVCDYYLEHYKEEKYENIGYLNFPAIKMKNRDEIAKYAFEMYKKYIWQSPCNKLYKTEVLKNLFFEEDRSYMMIVDSDFNMRLLNRLNSVVTINKPLVHYVQYDLNFRKQITSMWKYKYKRMTVDCEERLYNYFQNYYSHIDASWVGDKEAEINNYFVGRFLKIVQMLFLDRRLFKKFKKQELKYLKDKSKNLFENKDITYLPYRFLYKMILDEQWTLLYIIYMMLEYIQRYLPRLFSMMKAG